MMYQARPDTVKYYYWEIIKSPKTDAFACSKLLTFEEYMQCKPEWFTNECWESLCKYWCSAEYLKKRQLGQDSRKKNPDGAQNRGGSRPLVETQQFLGAKYGPTKGTVTNAFCCMRSGIKNCDANGNAGPIPEQTKKLIDAYNEALQDKYPDDSQEQPFDGHIAYKIVGGLAHGRLAIGDGVVKKAMIIDVAKASGTRPATSRAFQNLFARYEESIATVGQLTQQNTTLAQQNAALTRDVKRNARLLEGGAIDGSSHASANQDNSNGH